MNVRDPKEMQQLHQILSQADVIVENFRPGTMNKMGLGWEALHQRHPNPHLISAHASGFGQTGPIPFF
jgi:CoA:oxalate CoA-transferase